jgi:bifunctional non-homologous end joining protein LigD
MSLEKYKAKRNFKKTDEPKGKVVSSGKQLMFVVQQHRATQLHYDFRLELDGVLKSWAVPKGPSMDPKVKRLAMMVEDHPVDYMKFEGVIAEGYGAGEVIVWDIGTYNAPDVSTKKESEKLLNAGLAKGDLKFILNGQKLKGGFALVKMKSYQKNSWLLIKHKDEYATTKNILKEDRSVLSGKTIKEIG